MAILPLCRGSGSSGHVRLARPRERHEPCQEITGPLNANLNLPDWFQTQTGNPNGVENELMAYIHQPMLIPLHNQACRSDPGPTAR